MHYWSQTEALNPFIDQFGMTIWKVIDIICVFIFCIADAFNLSEYQVKKINQ